VRLPDFKEINLSPIEKTPREVEDLRQSASQTIESTFAAKAQEIADMQVNLALTAEDESVRMRAGQKIIEHIKGAPTQRIESKIASVRIVSHMPVPGFDMEAPAKLIASKSVAVTVVPKKIQKFKAASSPSGKSTYKRGPDTNVKKDGPMADVGESPTPRSVSADSEVLKKLS
jgi:hypothetical protein